MGTCECPPGQVENKTGICIDCIRKYNKYNLFTKLCNRHVVVVVVVLGLYGASGNFRIDVKQNFQSVFDYSLAPN